MNLKRKESNDNEYSEQDDDLLKELITNDEEDFKLEDNDFDPNFLGDDFSGFGPSNYEKQNDLLKNIMDFESYIKQLINGWLGLVWDEEKNKFVKDPYQTPIMNTIAANWCSNLLRTYARASNVITTINEDIYNEMMIDVGRVIIINVRSRSEEFGIKNQGDASNIINQLIASVKLMLSGLAGGKMGDVLKTTVHRQESLVLNDNNRPLVNNNPYQQPMPSKRGAFGFLNKLINGG